MAGHGARRGRGSAREAYPLLSAFGEAETRFLTHEEAIAATREQRIRSIWPFLVRAVLEFADSLPRRALANYDVEDILSELYLILAEKDAKWAPERGKYLSFAGRVITNELLAIRDRATTIHPPRNSAARLRGYEAEAPLAGSKAKTYSDIRRVYGDHESIESADPIDDDAADVSEAVARREERARRVRAVRKGIAALDPDESEALCRAHGLFGHDPEPPARIAKATGHAIAHVRRTLARAQAKFQERLEANHDPRRRP